MSWKDRAKERVQEYLDTADALRGSNSPGWLLWENRARLLLVGINQEFDSVKEFFSERKLGFFERAFTNIAESAALSGGGKPGEVYDPFARTPEEETAFFDELSQQVAALPEDSGQPSEFLTAALETGALQPEVVFAVDPLSQAQWEGTPRTTKQFYSNWVAANYPPGTTPPDFATVFADSDFRGDLDMLLASVVVYNEVSQLKSSERVSVPDIFSGGAPITLQGGTSGKNDLFNLILQNLDGLTALRNNPQGRTVLSNTFRTVTNPNWVNQTFDDVSTEAGSPDPGANPPAPPPPTGSPDTSTEDRLWQRLQTMIGGLTNPNEHDYAVAHAGEILQKFKDSESPSLFSWWDTFYTGEFKSLADDASVVKIEGRDITLGDRIAAFVGNQGSLEVRTYLTQKIKSVIRDLQTTNNLHSKVALWNDFVAGKGWDLFRPAINEDLTKLVLSRDNGQNWLDAFTAATGNSLAHLYLDAGGYKRYPSVDDWLTDVASTNITDGVQLGVVNDDRVKGISVVSDLFSVYTAGLPPLVTSALWSLVSNQLQTHGINMNSLITGDQQAEIRDLFTAPGMRLSLVDETLKNLITTGDPNRGQELINQIEGESRQTSESFSTVFRRVVPFDPMVSSMTTWQRFLPGFIEDSLGPVPEDTSGVAIAQSLADKINPLVDFLPPGLKSQILSRANQTLNDFQSLNPKSLQIEDIIDLPEFQSAIEGIVSNASRDFWQGNDMAEALMDAFGGTNDFFRRNPDMQGKSAEEIIQIMLDHPGELTDNFSAPPEAFFDARDDQLQLESFNQANIDLQQDALERRKAEAELGPIIDEMTSGLGSGLRQQILDQAVDALITQHRLSPEGPSYSEIVASDEFQSTVQSLVSESERRFFGENDLGKGIIEAFGGLQSFLSAASAAGINLKETAPGEILRQITASPEQFTALLPEGTDTSALNDLISTAQSDQALSDKLDELNRQQQEYEASPEATLIRNFQRSQALDAAARKDFGPEFERAVRSLAGGSRAQGIIVNLQPQLEQEFLKTLHGGSRPDLGGEFPALVSAGPEAFRQRAVSFLQEKITPEFITQQGQELRRRSQRFTTPVPQRQRSRRPRGGISPVSFPTGRA